MADDVVLNKAAVVERCIARVREEHAGDDANLMENMTRQDSIVLNLQRACEATIDLAMHMVKTNRLGNPQESRDAFAFLADADLLERDRAEKMMKMVGFRNIAVHDYKKLNLEIVASIIRDDLDAFLDFTKWAIQSGGPK